jgi:double-strand break repair protein MRE11
MLTVDIFKRYCMGPGAIQVQIVSGSAEDAAATATATATTATAARGGATNNNNNNNNNNSPFVRGYVNYEDENYSVDLPVFSIHGNHDDPSRDGGNSELYAALDLLDVSNLVNYFGKQQDAKDIRVDPILLRKGTTQVALYGLGSMRDERLNRMWRGEHLTFSRPAEDPNVTNNNGGDDDDPTQQWFNIFALHQNRDRGRGAKNCIKEDMIPDWMDFICWGHEHECDIEVTESVVGTFRISQPGSSVATSLVEGESMRKKIGILDIREGQFRLTAIPLTQVRSFVLGTVRLADVPRLDPDDPKVDTKVSKLLEEKVRVLIHDAREKRRELLVDAEDGGNVLAKYYNNASNDDSVDGMAGMPLKHTLHKEDEVLVRLKVDHTGFAAVNNQRFGAKFVGESANPVSM